MSDLKLDPRKVEAANKSHEDVKALFNENKSKHTSGPWKAITYGNGSWIIQNADENNKQYIGTIDRADPDNMANAALMAASPELLKALIDVELHLHQSNNGHAPPLLNKVRQAIKKANGD